MLRVIVADDEETIRNGLVRLIGRCALDLEVVAAAEDGRAAVALCKKYHPHIVLMDINMPGMTGLDAIEAIRTAEPETKIIIISGYGQFEYARRALTLGVFNYLLKPVDYRDFKEILQKAMECFGPRESPTPPDLGTQAADYIRVNYSRDLTAQALADHFHLSQSSLTRLIKQKTGQSFTDYLNNTRICAAKELLRDKDCTIAQISERVGYSSQHYLSRVFKNYTGISPQKYRGGAENGGEETPD